MVLRSDQADLQYQLPCLSRWPRLARCLTSCDSALQTTGCCSSTLGETVSHRAASLQFHCSPATCTCALACLNSSFTSEMETVDKIFAIGLQEDLMR